MHHSACNSRNTDLGGHILKLPIVQPPEDVVSRVSGDAEVDRVHQTEARVPDAGVSQILDQRVSDPDYLGLPVPGLGDEPLVLK